MSTEPDSNQRPKDVRHQFNLQSSALPTELSVVVCIAAVITDHIAASAHLPFKCPEAIKPLN